MSIQKYSVYSVNQYPVQHIFINFLFNIFTKKLKVVTYPFISPDLTLLERGNNGNKFYSHRPSLLKKRGDGGELKKEKGWG